MTTETPVELFTGLYHDEDGNRLSTHSMLKTMRRCPKQAEYKYVERLVPKRLGRPLRLGTWMHRLQEVNSAGGDWKEALQEMIDNEWANLFDDEKDEIGDLPGDCRRLMRSYLWHYKDDPWKFLDTEFTLEAEFPDGSIFRGKIDALVETRHGLYAVDRKWHKNLPDQNFRLLDAQSADYVWLCLKNDIPVLGFIWDYGRSKVPTYPAELKAGGPARWATVDTDYPTMVQWFKDHPKVDPNKYKAKLLHLKSMRYVHGQANASTFFRRTPITRDLRVIKRVIQEAYHTSRRMHEYPFDRPNIVERVPDRSCTFFCNYTDLCTAELMTGERPINWKRSYTQKDPLYYYNDDPDPREK